MNLEKKMKYLEQKKRNDDLRLEFERRKIEEREKARLKQPQEPSSGTMALAWTSVSAGIGTLAYAILKIILELLRRR